MFRPPHPMSEQFELLLSCSLGFCGLQLHAKPVSTAEISYTAQWIVIKMEESEAQGIYLTHFAYLISGGFIAFNNPLSDAWYLNFPFHTVGLLLILLPGIELILLRFYLKREIPTYTVMSFLAGFLLFPIAAYYRTPSGLPTEQIRIAVTTFSSGDAGEDLTDRLIINLKRARDRGLPIEIVEVESSISGNDDREKEVFAGRVGKARPISAHLVIWGRIAAGAAPYYSNLNITFANNPFKQSTHGYRDAPWLELASIEGTDHPRLWPKTSSFSDSAASLEDLLAQQTSAINELIEFLGGLILLEARQYSQLRQRLPKKSRSFNVRYLRAIASVEQGIETASRWFEDNGDFILHAPLPNDVTARLDSALAEMDSLLLPSGINAAREAKGVAWYAYYTRTRAKQIMLFSRGVFTEYEVATVRESYRMLLDAAKVECDTTAEIRAFLEFSRLQLITTDSMSQRQIAASILEQLNQYLAHAETLPPEIRAMLYLRRGNLCAAPEWKFSHECALRSYRSALKLFRALSAPLGEAAVYEAMGRLHGLDPSKSAQGRSVSAYVSAIEIYSKSRYADAGTRAEAAWHYLNAVLAFHQGDVPPQSLSQAYDFVMQSTYGSRPLRIRGAGDVFLQDALTEMKYTICEELSVDRVCWQKIVEHVNSLLTSFVDMEDERTARYYAIRASAFWEISKLENGTHRDQAYNDFVSAILMNNEAGGSGDALSHLVDLYARMLRTIEDADALDAMLFVIVRKDCVTRGNSVALAESDSFAHRIHISIPQHSVAAPVRCARTTLADAFDPVLRSIPTWNGSDLGGSHRGEE